MKNIRIFSSENFPFYVVNFSMYLNRRVFVMDKNNFLSSLSRGQSSFCFHGRKKSFKYVSMVRL